MKMTKLRLFVISALVLACAVSLAAVHASLPGTAAAEEDSGCVHYSNPDADMKLALTEANMSGLSLEVLSLVLSNYEELAQEGLGDLGTQALIKYYDVQDVEE